MELLQHKKIRAAGANETLMKVGLYVPFQMCREVVQNPVEKYLPPGSRRFGMSVSGRQAWCARNSRLLEDLLRDILLKPPTLAFKLWMAKMAKFFVLPLLVEASLRGSMQPSSILGCPAGYKDCGSCRCVPEATCQWCNDAPALPTNASTIRPSTVFGCPASFKDCGTCLCVPEGSCQYCPGVAAPVVSPGNSNVRPSAVLGCPFGYKDCGTCRCVPESTCQWCPGAYTPALPSTNESSSIRPSSIFGCPASFKDCGTCLCVPESSCEYCPGVAAPAVTPGQDIRPSAVIGCPLGFKDCGTCRCVPESTCQWCPGRRLNATSFEGVV